jgi:riboflavin synthase
MFTGIITSLGTVDSIEQRGDLRMTIASDYDPQSIAIGASIACSGVCLTVVEAGPGRTRNSWFAVDVSAETLARSTLGRWRVGTPVNLERSLKIGDELGGHLVFGHADGVASVKDRRRQGDSVSFRFAAPPGLARYIAEKGSIALDGTSLTVNEVAGSEFAVNIIPHTLAVTSFGARQVGDEVNVEVDMLARYVARLREFPVA